MIVWRIVQYLTSLHFCGQDRLEYPRCRSHLMQFPNLAPYFLPTRILGPAASGATMGKRRCGYGEGGNLLYLTDADTSSDEEPIKPPPPPPPPPKRMKYVPSRIETERPTNRMHRRDDPNATFDICVGKSQRLFTLNEKVFTQRSLFLRNAREQAKRWWRRNKAKMLAEEDPEVFSAYVSTVCFGVDFLKKRIASDAGVDSGLMTDDEDKVEQHLDAKKAKTVRFMVDLYVLAADKLLDPVTANLIIDVLTGYLKDIELDVKLLFAIIPYFYASTQSGSLLRILTLNLFINEMCGLWAEDVQARGLPYEFLQEFAVEICHLQF